MAHKTNEKLLAKYLGLTLSKSGKPKKQKVKNLRGRPRKHAPGSQRVGEDEKKITFIGKIEHAEAMKSAAQEQGITIKQAYAQAIEEYLTKMKR